VIQEVFFETLALLGEFEDVSVLGVEKKEREAKFENKRST